ncbi:hypothetical protein QVD17_38520 [Tagetes erecta]|uniref:Uncharacterized protein n=1 Tax=Tagetes erecta TaxID=13708 RepID=A0AAD8JNL9_TARER|nr:hypothetical protein QVD17_38520 [Tagetes erecta]
MKWAANHEIVNKHRIKPRKMRLMVDIYKTATRCTAKELDARNDGSQKKEQKSGKVYLRKKKNTNHERKHDHQKYLKQSLNRKKSSFEVTVGLEENNDNGICCIKEAMGTDDLQVIRPPWACSKRTVFAEKNLIDKSFLKSGFKPASSLLKSSQKTGSLSPNKVHIAKNRSLMSTKPSSKHLKKRGTILNNNNSEDPYNSCLVKGSDVRSTGGKSLLSFSRKTASKINLKRAFSALERYQDSLKHKSWVKETTSESMNLLEVKKNEKMETCKPEFDSNFSKSLNEDPSCGIEFVRKPTRLNKEQVSTMQVPRRSDNTFDSRERVTDVTNDMSDSPNSTVSNPSLAAPRNDEKYALNTLSSGDLKSKGQSQTIGFKNDHDQPFCCSRKEISSSRPSPLPSPTMKLSTVRECDSAVGSFKPVIRLMGKNLTVVNTNEDNNVQNCFKSQHSTLLPPYSLNNHALDTVLKDYSFIYGATDTNSLFHKLL